MKNQDVKVKLKIKSLTKSDKKKALSKLKNSVKFNSNRKVELDRLKSFPRRSSSNKKLDAFFDNLITIEELADYIGVSQKTIRNWVAMRSIPFLRIGRKTFFYFEKLDKWFQTKEFEPCQ